MYGARHQILKRQKINAVGRYHDIYFVYESCAEDCDVSMPQVSHGLLSAFRRGESGADACCLERCTLIELESGERVGQKAMGLLVRPTQPREYHQLLNGNGRHEENRLVFRQPPDEPLEWRLEVGIAVHPPRNHVRIEHDSFPRVLPA